MPGFVFRTELKETDQDKQAAELSGLLNMILENVNGIMVNPHPNDKKGKSEIKKMRCGDGSTKSGYFKYEYTQGSPFSKSKE